MNDKLQMKELASSLRALRREHQYTQQQLADLIGVKRLTYTNYELGKNRPNIFVLVRIAEVYGITVDAILHNTEVNRFFCNPTKSTNSPNPDRT